MAQSISKSPSQTLFKKKLDSKTVQLVLQIKCPCGHRHSINLSSHQTTHHTSQQQIRCKEGHHHFIVHCGNSTYRKILVVSN